MGKKTVNIIFCGVGGQGVLSASEIVAEVFMKLNYDVKLSAARGMAQRLGRITSHVRIGDKVYSPIIEKGDCDILVAMEMSEAIRHIDYIKNNGLVIFLDKNILPGSQSCGLLEYPVISKEVKEIYRNSFEIFHHDLMNDNILTNTNMYVLGVLSNYFSIRQSTWEKIIKERFSGSVLKRNVFAFRTGQENKDYGKTSKIYI